MIINEEGTYTLRYTATDSCGKTTEVERELVVADTSPRRTVLYTDGTFIINEKQTDEAHNIELHGAATNVYIPFDPNGATNEDKYIFGVQTARPWGNEASSIKSVEIGSPIQPTNTDYWFYGFSTMTGIDLSKLDTSNTVSMVSMFRNCSSITSIDLDGFNTGNVISMARMFSGCTVLANLDLSSFNTAKVESMEGMFQNCKEFLSLDVSTLNTAMVTSMYEMFDGCSKLEALDLSNFNTSRVTNMEEMFSGCSKLNSLNLGNFDTSSVTTMRSMFNFCRNLLSLDLSSFNTTNLTDMYRMFYYCDKMTTIYASSGFDVAGVTSSTGTFENMSSSLKGGAGTTWSSSNPKDKTYARIDGGTSSNRGYFTAKS